MVMGLLSVVPQAMREAKTGSRQRTSEGIVTAYARSNHNQCSYRFSVLGTRFDGRSSAETTDVKVGDHVLVYYDTQNPTANALEDFYKKSRRDRGFCYMLLFVIGIFNAVVVLSKAAHVRQADGSTIPKAEDLHG